MPQVMRAYPDARFVHVVRDGRDLAYSSNKGDWWNMYKALFGKEFVEGQREEETLATWARLNSAAADFGATLPPERYLLVHIEDLTDSDPAVRFAAFDRIRRWVGVLDADQASDVCAALVDSENAGFFGSFDPTLTTLAGARMQFGKWKKHDKVLWDDALERFGYGREGSFDWRETRPDQAQARLDSADAQWYVPPTEAQLDICHFTKIGQNVHIGRRTESVYADSPGECCELCAARGKDECRAFGYYGRICWFDRPSTWRRVLVFLLPRLTGTVFYPAAGVVAGSPR